MAGKIQKQLAEKSEIDLKYDLSIKYYKSAADYFSMENLNSKSYEQSCLLKMADLMILVNHPDTFKEGTQVTDLFRYMRKLQCSI